MAAVRRKTAVSRAIARSAASSSRRAASIALDPFPVDLHQIHMGFGSLSSTRSQLHAMARLAAAHEIGAVGVSNFSARQMEAAHAALAEHDI
ncbi:hypothetical protein [Mycobacterium sp.]|uniref:hypothetical protein n=1 Tax=Mycobacterium sp. TaxID=1785 RepID=UPI00333FC728